MTADELGPILCDDQDARRIAGALDEPCFDESNPVVQTYWLAMAQAALNAHRLIEALRASEAMDKPQITVMDGYRVTKDYQP
jgi:hypothetical protein